MAQEGFLGRWARLKRDVDATDRAADAGELAGGGTVENLQPGPVAPQGDDVEAKAEASAATLPSPGMRMGAAGGASEGEASIDPAGSTTTKLPSIDSLTRDSDYSMFMQKDVDPQVRVGALKKLFADPHFNRMDGLDVYIDDYSKPDPMPLAFLKRLNQARILGLAEEEDDVAEAPVASAAAAAPDSSPAGAVGDSGDEDGPATADSNETGIAATTDAATAQATPAPPEAGGGEAAAAMTIEPASPAAGRVA